MRAEMLIELAEQVECYGLSARNSHRSSRNRSPVDDASAISARLDFARGVRSATPDVEPDLRDEIEIFLVGLITDDAGLVVRSARLRAAPLAVCDAAWLPHVLLGSMASIGFAPGQSGALLDVEAGGGISGCHIRLSFKDVKLPVVVSRRALRISRSVAAACEFLGWTLDSSRVEGRIDLRFQSSWLLASNTGARESGGDGSVTRRSLSRGTFHGIRVEDPIL